MDVYKTYLKIVSPVRRVMTHPLSRLKILTLLVLISLCTSIPISAKLSDNFPEVTYNGVRYIKLTQKDKDLSDYPDQMLDLLWLGFSVNPDDETTYIAPGGDIIPKFDDALYIGVPMVNNGDVSHSSTLPSYSGDIYIPDYVEVIQTYSGEISLPDKNNETGNSDGIQKLYVLQVYTPSAFGNGLSSLRTPVYMSLFKSLKDAINLKKIQIGTGYSVDYCSLYGCTRLETVIFERAPYIYEYAFANCRRIQSIVLLSETELPVISDSNVFEDSIYENTTLYLPDNLMDACNNDPNWSKFVHKKSLKECPVEIMKP